MEKLLKEIGTIEEDQKRLESIYQLEKAFNEVKASYSQEYNETLLNAMKEIKSKMKRNPKMKEAVNSFVNIYVHNNKKDEATEALYDMLAAEMLETLQTLSHTSCSIM